MFHPDISEVSQPTDKVAEWLNTIAQNLFILTLGLSPLLFIPTPLVPLAYSKVLLLIIGVVTALVLQSLAILRSGTVTLRAPIPLIAMAGVFLVMLVSAVLSGDVRDGLVGNAFGTQTVSFVGLLLLIAFASLMLKDSKIAVMRLYLLFLGSSVVLGLFHVTRFFIGADSLSLGIFGSTVSTPLGGWNDLALYFGAVLLIALVVAEQLPLSKINKVLLAALALLSLVILAVVNFVFVWAVLALVSIVLLMFNLTKHRFSSSQLPFESDTSGSITSIVLSASVFLVSALFFIGGSTFGPMIGNYTDINYLEVRPSLTATFDIARQSLKENALLGIGPNKFIDAWRMYKDQSINQTIFWNTNFEAGNGYITTSLITTGVLGFIAWVLFLGLLLWSGMKLLFRHPHQDRFWQFVSISSFVTAIYLWGMSVVYVPSASTLILAAAATGIFVTTYVSMIPGREWTMSVMNNRNFGLVLILASMLTIFGSIGSLYFVGQHYLALYNFNHTLTNIKPGDNLDDILNSIESAYQLSANDNFARQVAAYSLSQMEVLLTAEDTNENAELFREVAQNSISAAQTAVEKDKTEPLNWVMLGRVYSTLTVAGVEGAYDRATEAFTKANELDPQNPLILLLSAQATARTGDNQSALQLAERAVSMKSNYIDALLLLTQLEIAAGNVNTAIERAQAVATLEPNNPARYYQLGILHSADGDTDAAVSAFERAVALDNSFSNARYFLALNYAELGRPEEAKEQLEIVLQLNPGNELVVDLINQLDETGTITIAPSDTSPVEEVEVSVSDNGQVSTDEAPDTPLVSTVNGNAEEEIEEPETNPATNN